MNHNLNPGNFFTEFFDKTSEFYVNWNANSGGEMQASAFYGLHIKLKLLKTAIWCVIFMTVAPGEMFKKYSNAFLAVVSLTHFLLSYWF